MVFCRGLDLGQGSRSHRAFDLWLFDGRECTSPIQITEGGAVRSQDFSPDSVEWGTPKTVAGHHTLG